MNGLNDKIKIIGLKFTFILKYSKDLNMLIQLPRDGGPVYAETDLTALVAEPWNAVSSLAILFPALYWGIRLRGEFSRFPFLYSCMPLLLLGGLGSTLYHAFRSSNLLLMLDVLPTALLMILIGIYFWFKVLPVWWQVFSIVLPLTATRFVLFELMPPEMAVNLGYFISGTSIFLPVLIYLKRSHFAHYQDIVLSIGFLSASLLFRDLDHRVGALLPMGSHFLWHLLSGLGAFWLANYLYKLRLTEIRHESGLKAKTTDYSR